MKVKELIAELSKLDPDRIVILQNDSEGNGYSPLASLWTGAYRADTTWYGEAGLESLSQSDIKDGYSELDIVTGGAPAVMLVPVN